jgi:hypothetical protein
VALLDRARLRMLVYFIVIALLLVLFFNRTSPLNASAEQLTTQTTINIIKRALVIGAYLKKQNGKSQPKFSGKNPVGLLIEPMLDYQGLVVNKKQLKPGFWAYDTHENILLYRVKNSRFFKSGQGPYISLAIIKKGNQQLVKISKHMWCQKKRHWGCAKW